MWNKLMWKWIYFKGFNMEDGEFNYHRLVTSEKKVAHPALQDLFETLWNQKYPETPWGKNAASVKLFEEKEDERFQNSLKKLATKKQKGKIYKRNQLETTFRDDDWKDYQWDTGKYVYALVNCKLFTLDQTDKTGKQISAHIKKIKDIRNKIAHFANAACDTNYFEQTLDSLAEHIKALGIVNLNATPYLEELQKIKKEEKPVSAKEHYELRFDSEKLKNLQKMYEEREKHFEEINKLREKYEEQDREKGKISWEAIKNERKKHHKAIKKQRKKHRNEMKKERDKRCEEKKNEKKKHGEEINKERETHCEEMKKEMTKHCEEMKKERETHCEEMKKETENHCEKMKKERETHTEEMKQMEEENNKLKEQLDELSAELANLKAGNRPAKDKHTSTKSISKKTWFDAIKELLNRFLNRFSYHAT